jgi:hypothetical protein
MDLETISNCFIAVFEDYASDERFVFRVNRNHNQLLEFYQFIEANLATKSWHFSFNGLGFDAQVVQWMLDNKELLMAAESTEEITHEIYKFAQRVIDTQKTKERLPYPEWKIKIPQLDIFKLNHWDNKAKMSSLKWIQYTMDWKNVEEMPHHHTKPVEDDDTLNRLTKYCINDVRSTKAIFNYQDAKGKYVMKEQIQLRKELSQKYGLNLYSASEPRISKELFLHFLSERMGRDKRDIRNYRTMRPEVRIADIILPYVEFRDPAFQEMFNWFKSQVVEINEETFDEDESKKSKGPKHTMVFNGVKTDYGLGGLHGCIKSGVYEAGNGFCIMSADVTSFYPNLSIKNRWGPAHLPNEIFCDLYEWMFEERKKHPKGSALNYVFKIILNSTYGLSKNRHSFLYDPELTFKITVNGQLLLSMLYERLAAAIPEAIPLMQNTDGLEFMIPETAKPVFMQVCKEWEEMTKLELEFAEYSKMIIGDVNNYIAIYKKEGKEPKCKGRFEFKELALHKNKSFLVIPKALYAYFVDGIQPEDYLKSNRNLYDYCAGVKMKGQWSLRERYILNGDYHDKLLQRMARYYISKKGKKLYKVHPDGRSLQIEAGRWLQTLLNDSSVAETMDFDQLDIDERYYLEAINQEIRKIESNQLRRETVQYQLF